MKPPAAALRRRLYGLLACTLAGTVVGALVQWLTGSGAGYLAVPAAIAIGWLFVADPTQCTPPPRR